MLPLGGRFGVVVVAVVGGTGGSVTGPMKPAAFGEVAFSADFSSAAEEPARDVGLGVVVGAGVDVSVFVVVVGLGEVVVDVSREVVVVSSGLVAGFSAPGPVPDWSFGVLGSVVGASGVVGSSDADVLPSELPAPDSLPLDPPVPDPPAAGSVFPELPLSEVA